MDDTLSKRHPRTAPGSTRARAVPTGRSWLAVLLVGAPIWTGCATVRPVDDVIREMPVTAETPQGTEVGFATAAEVPAPTPSAAVPPAAPDAEIAVPVPDGIAAPDVLPARDDLRAYSDRALDEYDRLCRQLLERARAEGASYDELMEASRALAFNADLRIQSHLAFRFDPADLPEPKALIDAEDDVSSKLKGEVRSLARSSKELAEAALSLRDGDPAGRLFATLGAGLYLWSLGPIEAIASGGATSLPKKIKALAKDHPSFEGASPLRLKGRFESRAPWPYKDKSGGVATLEEAVKSGPIPLNLLFLGDAYWINGQEAEAVRTWELATRADADEETKIAAPLLREIARLRVLSASSQ